MNEISIHVSYKLSCQNKPKEERATEKKAAREKPIPGQPEGELTHGNKQIRKCYMYYYIGLVIKVKYLILDIEINTFAIYK